MKLKLFTSQTCPNCPPAKEFAEKIKSKIEVEYFDIDTSNGLAEAAMYGVMSVPSLVLVDNEDNELELWRGEVPTDEQFETKIIFHKEDAN